MAKGKKKQNISAEELLEQALVPKDEQPYEVPDNWVWTRLGSVCKEVQYGYTAKSSTEEIGPKLLRITDIQDGGVDWSNVPFCKISQDDYIKFKLEQNDIVVARTGATTGKSFLISDQVDSVFASYLIRVKLNNCLNFSFLYYFMQSVIYWSQITDLAQGIAQPGVNASKLQTMNYPLPPLAEQQRIVDRIESLFAKLDQAKELIQNALESFETRKAAILHKAFTGELTAKWREEHGVGMESWERKKLKDCGEWYGGGTPSKSISSYWENGTIMWVTPKDMKEKYIVATIDHITDIAVVESSIRLIEHPSLLFVMRSGILRRILPISIATKKVTVNQDLKALIPEGIELEYLYWFCVAHESDIREKCSKSGTTVESIETTALYNYETLIPSKEEQLEIISTINRILDHEERAKELCNIIESVETMKKTILARAFRGELGTNDPTEESAVGVLKEILVKQ